MSGTGVTGGVVTDASVYQEEIYRIRFTDAAGSYEIYNYDDDQVVATGTVALGAGSISFDGVQIDYNLAALPAQGEYWELPFRAIEHLMAAGISFHVAAMTDPRLMPAEERRNLMCRLDAIGYKDVRRMMA